MNGFGANQTGLMNNTNNQFISKAANTTGFGFGNNTTIAGGVPLNPENFVLEGVAIEFELKSSDFATIISKNLVEAAIL